MIGGTKTNIGGATVFLVVALSLPSAASAGGVASIIADLYGGDGIVLDAGPDAPNHIPHFTLNSQVALDDLSAVIASNANIFALPAASASYTFDLEAGIPVRTTNSFGPILTERPQTIGQGNVNVGFFFSRTVFEQFGGDDLNDLTLVLAHVDCCPPPPPASPGVPAFELDTVNLDIDLQLEQTTFAVFGTYGITGFWDVSALVPLVYIDAEVDSVGTIIDNGGGGVHVVGTESLTDSNDDSAFGFGDVVLRTKANLTDFLFQSNGSNGSWIPSFGLLGQATLEDLDLWTAPHSIQWNAHQIRHPPPARRWLEARWQKGCRQPSLGVAQGCPEGSRHPAKEPFQ